MGPSSRDRRRYLSKGRPVAIDGRLEWREWEGKDGVKRQAVSIIADSVQFLGSRDPDPVDVSSGSQEDLQPVPVGAAAGEDDIPF